MIDLSTIDHIFLYPGNTDLRKGRVALRHMYEKDTTGVWVYIRSLDESRFGWPKNINEAKQINKSQVEWLLRGLKYIKFDEKSDKVKASF